MSTSMKQLSPLLLLVMALLSCEELEHSNPNDPLFKLNPPDNFQLVVLSDSEIKLSWSDNSEHESGFRIERDGGDGFEQIVELNANMTKYTDTGLEYGTSYTYRIAGFISNNVSIWASSNSMNTTIPVPSSLIAITINELDVELNWADNCSYEKGYRIDRDDGSGFEQIAELGTNVTQYIDLGLDYDISYTYKVVAFTTDNISDYSNTETIRISSFEGMWNGTWKITSTTNQYSSSQLRQNETMTFSNAIYDGSIVSGNVTLVSIYHGTVSGPFRYNPTGQTLVINYSENPYEESFNGVAIDDYTLSFSNNDYSFNMAKQVNITTYDATTWNGTWKVSVTTNQYSSSQLRINETMTFSSSVFDGSIVSGVVSLVSIYHGLVSGSFTYSPTGQTLVIDYAENPYEESFNGVSIVDLTLSFSNNDYDFTLNKEEDVIVYDTSLWNGTWKVTNTTNQYSSSQLNVNEILTFSDATFDGTIVSGNTTMVSIYHGTVSGPFTYNPTGKTLIIVYTGNPYEESFNGVVIDGTTLSFSNNDYEFTLTKQ